MGPAWKQTPATSPPFRSWSAADPTAADRLRASGYEDGTFRPTRTITRGAATRLLWRLAGAPTDADPHSFDDIPPWLDDATVNWITAPRTPEPYATGFADNTFRPTRPLTRAQIARLVHRLLTTAS